MKTLYLVRHAKSSWEDPALTDIERPLNKRGIKDAPKMGKVLKKADLKPDCIITSHARRALETAEIIADKIGFPIKKVKVVEKLYLASTCDFFERISKLDDKLNTVVIVGHNPGLTSLANQLSNASIDNIPTCGIFVVKFDLKHWRKVSPRSGGFVSFDYPKNHK